MRRYGLVLTLFGAASLSMRYLGSSKEVGMIALSGISRKKASVKTQANLIP
jgi:hypothetical protein